MRNLVLAAVVALSSVAMMAAEVSGAPVRESTVPGTVLSSQPLSAEQLIPAAARGYRLIYRTTGQNGEPVVSGGSVYVPAGTPPPGGWRVVSWGHGTSGMTEGCTPNLDGGMADTFNETPQLSSYLTAGYAVEATDYVGLGAEGVYEYLGGRAAGHAVIDIVRAAQALEPALSHSYVLAGHSIGGQSVLAAAQMSSNYAPELDLHGTLAYAPTSNVDDMISALARPGVPAMPFLDGFQARLVMILAGLAHARPELHVGDYLSPWGKQAVDIARAGRGCMSGLDAAIAGKPIGSLFSKPISDPAITAAIQDYLGVPTAGYHRPVALLQGASDTLQPVPTTLLLQQQLQQSGVDSQLHLYPSATHFTVLSLAAADSAAFLERTLPAR